MATLPQYVDLSLSVEHALQIIRGEAGNAGLDDVLVASAAARVAYDHRVLSHLLTAARDLHKPDGALDCVGCMAAAGFGNAGDPHIPWPCATAKALGTPRVEMAVRWDPA